jgi:hypothetical protein
VSRQSSKLGSRQTYEETSRPSAGVPQLSVENILRGPQDIFDDDIFNTELGDKILPKGSFLEVRRSAYQIYPLLVCS